jgi:hypothetical protein
MRNGPDAVTRALHAMRTAGTTAYTYSGVRGTRCPTLVALHAVARALHVRCTRPVNFVSAPIIFASASCSMRAARQTAGPTPGDPAPGPTVHLRGQEGTLGGSAGPFAFAAANGTFA